MFPDSACATFGRSGTEAMTEAMAEQGIVAADAAAPASECAMTPTQALTARFEAGEGAIEHVVLPSETAEKVSRFSGVESRQGFRIGELGLMIRYEDGSELSELSGIHRLPNAPEWFCGIANLRGKLTPVFDLARYLGIDFDPAAKRMLLVLSRGSDATGVMIDGLPERLRWSVDEYTDAGAAPQKLMPHLRGASHIGGRLWFDLDAHSLLGELEHSLSMTQ